VEVGRRGEVFFHKKQGVIHRELHPPSLFYYRPTVKNSPRRKKKKKGGEKVFRLYHPA